MAAGRNDLGWEFAAGHSAKGVLFDLDGDVGPGLQAEQHRDDILISHVEMAVVQRVDQHDVDLGCRGSEGEVQRLDRLHGGEDSVNKHQAWNGLGVGATAAAISTGRAFRPPRSGTRRARALRSVSRSAARRWAPFSSRFTDLIGMPPSSYRRQAARATAGLPPCVANQVTRPIRNQEAPLPSRG
jgi:hypothetical protein